MRKTILAAFVAALTWPAAAQAADEAIIIANSNYQSLGAVPDAQGIAGLRASFAGAGYRVTVLQNADRVTLADALVAYGARHSETERLVIVLAGRFLTTGPAAWFAPTDLAAPDLARAATGALPLSSLMAWLGDRPGQAALFLGVAAPGTTGPGPLAPGIGNLAVAQGVFVATAPPDMLRRAIASDFMAPGTSVALASRARPDLDTHGFVSPLLMLGLRPDAPAIAGGGDEASYWQAVTDMDSKAAYRAYLGRFPTGRFAADARARIDAIEAAKPETTPEEDAEVALALTRNDRREVQRWLELLGFDPRGIDGVFGPGTRAAITRWQARNGVAATGFLSAGNLTRMRNQSGARAAELRAEADRQKAAQDARDAAFWRQTGARGGEANLRAYLAEFPDGLFADAAKAGLRDIETANRNRERAEVRHAWDAARSADTAAAYRRFLERYPDSAFAGQAQAALDQASKAGDQRAERQAAKAEEESLGLSPELMRQVELRLARAGYETGTPDGDFDRATRRAIRQYQRARGLDVTGFLTRQTAVRLLSE